MVGKEEEEGRRKKSPEKKPLRRDWDLNPRTLSPEPSVLSIRPWHPAKTQTQDSLTFALNAQPSRVGFQHIPTYIQRKIHCVLMPASALLRQLDSAKA